MLASQINFTYRYIDDVLSISNPDFENFLGHMYPDELEIKDTTERNTLLPTWIYSCRSGGTVSCALPFTTNVTISTFISQTFRSWVAIFHLRQPMTFLSHSPYGMPGIALPMNVLFSERRDFHLSSWDRDSWGNAWNRPLGSFMVDMEISLNIIKSPSPTCDMTFWDNTTYSDTLNWSDITPISELMTELDRIIFFDHITKFRRFPYNIATGAVS